MMAKHLADIVSNYGKVDLRGSVKDLVARVVQKEPKELLEQLKVSAGLELKKQFRGELTVVQQVMSLLGREMAGVLA